MDGKSTKSISLEEVKNLNNQELQKYRLYVWLANGNATKQPKVVRIIKIYTIYINGKVGKCVKLLDEHSNETFEIPFDKNKKTIEDLYKEHVILIYNWKQKNSNLKKEDVIQESIDEARKTFFSMKPSEIDVRCGDNDFYLYKYQPIKDESIKDTSGHYLTENFGIMTQL